MKKILSLILAFSFFASEANFMDKVKALPATAKEFAVATKDFGINTINTARQNKKATLMAALQIGIVADRLYTLGKPTNYNLLCEDKANFLSTSVESPLGIIITKLCAKASVKEDNKNKILNKGIKPLTHVQNLFNNGYGFTLGLLEVLRRLALKAE